MARVHKHDRHDFSGANPPSVIRQQAIAEGKRFYETGQPCKRGHIAPRYTINHVCVQCNAEKARADRSAAAQRKIDERAAEAKKAEQRQRKIDGIVRRQRAVQYEGADPWWETHEQVTWYSGFLETSNRLLASGRKVWEKP